MSAASGSRSLAPERRLFAEPFPLLLRCFTFTDQKIVNRCPDTGVRNIMCLPVRHWRIAARHLLPAMRHIFNILQPPRDGKILDFAIAWFQLPKRTPPPL